MRFCKSLRSIYWVYLPFILSPMRSVCNFSFLGRGLEGFASKWIGNKFHFRGELGAALPISSTVLVGIQFFVFTVMLFVFVALKHRFFFDSEFARSQDTTQHYSQMDTWGIWWRITLKLHTLINLNPSYTTEDKKSWMRKTCLGTQYLPSHAPNECASKSSEKLLAQNNESQKPGHKKVQQMITCITLFRRRHCSAGFLGQNLLWKQSEFLGTQKITNEVKRKQLLKFEHLTPK